MSLDLATIGIGMETSGLEKGKKALDDASKSADSAANAADRATDSNKRLSSSSDLLSSTLKTLASAYAALRVAEYVKDSALLAARYETLGVTMRVVGQNSGYTASQMDAAAQGMQKMGISMVESRQQAMRLVQAHIDLADSQKLARIAQDAAVIGNMNSSDAFAAMIHGISTGQTDVLRTIGLNVSMEQSYKTMASTLGKNVDALTQNERTQGVLNAVMKAGADIAGTYEAAMDTAGKQLNSMKRYTEDLKTVQGEVFNEVLTTAVMAYTSHLKESNEEMRAMAANGELKAWGMELASVFVGVANAIDNIMTGVKMAGTWMAQRNVAGDITEKYQAKLDAIPKGFGAGGVERGRLVAQRDKEIKDSLALMDDSMVELGKRADRFQSAWDARQASMAEKATKSLAETQSKDSSYTTAMNAYAKQREAGLMSEAEYVKAVKSTYQGMYGDNHKYKDTEPAAKPDKGPASAYDSLSESIRRNLDMANEEMMMGDKLSAADKQRTRDIGKVTEAFVYGKITEMQWSQLYNRAMEASDARRDADANNYTAKYLETVNEKISIQQQELLMGRELTEGEKMAAKFTTQLFEGKLNLLDAQKVEITTALEKLISDEKANAAHKQKIKSIEAESSALEALNTQRKQHDRELTGIGQGTQARSRSAGLSQIEDKYSQQALQLESDKRRGAFKDNPEQYQEELGRISRFKEQATAEYETYYDKLIAKQKSWNLGASEGLANYLDDTRNVYKSIGDVVGKSFKGMEDALVSFVKTGKLDFASLADSIITELIRIQIQQSVMPALSSGVESLLGRLFGGSKYTPGSNNFVGPMPEENAMGGVYSSPSLSAYSSGVYSTPQTFAFAKGAGVFAEAGPEAIMPLSRGSDGKLGVKGSGSNVNVTVNVIEDSGKAGTQQTRESDNGGGSIIDIYVEKIKSSIAGDISRGSGAVPNALSSTYGLNRVAGAY